MKPLPTRDSQTGFALPIAIGLGLIAVLVGLTAVLRAQDDRNVAFNSRGATESELAAASGITQIQSFLNRYRQLARVSACPNEAWDATSGDCTVTGSAVTDANWDNPGLIPNLNAACGTGTLDASRNAVQAFTNNNWRPVDTSNNPDLSLGEYRLINYDTNGTLTVEGAVRRGDSGESFSRIRARIPIFDINNEQTAGLWVRSSITGNPVVNADVIAPCGTTVNLDSNSAGDIIRTQMAMPTAPAEPSAGTGVYNLVNISSLPGDNTVITDASGMPLPLTGKKLPRLISNNNGTTTDDVPDALGVYNYIVDDLDDSFEIVPGTAVNIWVRNDTIDLTNGRRIVNPCNAAGATSNCGPFDVKIYGSSNSASRSIRFDASSTLCDLFFHMPNHTLNISSGGSTDFTCSAGQKVTSIFWVNQSSGSLNNDNLLLPRATWSQVLNATSIDIPPPRLGQIQVWEPDS